MDLGQIAPLLSSINAVTTIARGMVGLRDEAMLQQKVNELLREIMSANSAAMSAQVASLSLVQQIDELKKKLATLEAWEREKSRYQLVDHGGETFTYLLKSDAANGEPIHKLCTTCFAKGQKSILNFRFHTDYGRDFYRCDPCDKEFPLGRPSRRTSMRSGDDCGLNWKTV